MGTSTSDDFSQREVSSSGTGHPKKKAKGLTCHIALDRSSYGGMGVAKPSAWTDLTADKFNSKLTTLFDEHIQGWSGKSYTKAMKKQQEKANGGAPLWKQMMMQKQKNAGTIIDHEALVEKAIGNFNLKKKRKRPETATEPSTEPTSKQARNKEDNEKLGTRKERADAGISRWDKDKGDDKGGKGKGGGKGGKGKDGGKGGKGKGKGKDGKGKGKDGKGKGKDGKGKDKGKMKGSF